MTTPSKLKAIGIVVQDMRRALAFYRNLGFEFKEGSESEEHVETETGGGITLMLDVASMVPTFDPGWKAPSGSPRVAFAFECDSPAEVDKLYERLLAAGAGERRGPWDAVWGMRYALLLDPDGNGIDLYAKL